MRPRHIRPPAAIAAIAGLAWLPAQTRAAQLQPMSDPEPLAVARGDSLIAAFRTEAAVEAYRAGLAHEPDDPVLLGKAALALSSLAEETPGREGDEAVLEEAVALARRAVEAGPRISRAHTALAVALGRYAYHLGHVYRVARAREVIDLGRQSHAAAVRAARLDPGDWAPQVVLGTFHRELAVVHPLAKLVARTFLGGYPDVTLEESAEHLAAAVRLAPDRVTPRLQLARTWLAMDREEDARLEIEAALALPARSRLERIEQERARERLEELG